MTALLRSTRRPKTGEQKKRLKKRIEDFEDYQMDQVDSLIQNDPTGTLAAWFEGLVDLDPDSPTFLSEMDDSSAILALQDTDFWK